MKCLAVGHRRQASLFHNLLKYKGFSLWRDGERLGKGCSWGAIFPSANFGGRPLTQDPVGQPFGVLSFLSYSQTLGPPPSPLCRFSVSKRSTRDCKHNRGVASAEQRCFLRIL